MVETYSLSITASYFQIYIYDASLDLSQVESDASWWTSEDHKRMLSLKELNRLLVMATFRDFTVPVEVVVFKETPVVLPIQDWDHINECSLRTEMGAILIGGIFDEVVDSLLITGATPYWRVRLYYGGQATIDQMGLDGHDHYRIELWPTNSTQPLAIIKQNSYYLT